MDILAYCLMTNHIHLVGVPATEHGLQQTLKPLPCAMWSVIRCGPGWCEGRRTIAGPVPPRTAD